jgi:hypothetical protein
MNALEGLVSLQTLEVAADECIVMAQYHTKEQSDNAVPTVMRILGGAFAPLITQPPVMKDGPVTWSL